MKRELKRFLSTVLAAAMMLCMVQGVVFAEENTTDRILSSATAKEYSDITSEWNWAREAIYYWSEKGIINGYAGRFDPAGQFTRAQSSLLMANLLKLSDKKDISKYTDLNPAAWYYEGFEKTAAAGIFQGTGDTTMSPDEAVTREMYFAMVAKALNIPTADYLTKSYPDAEAVSGWAKPYVYGLIEKGFVTGISGSICPQKIIDRASAVVLLAKIIKSYEIVDGKVVITLIGEEASAADVHSGSAYAADTDEDIPYYPPTPCSHQSYSIKDDGSWTCSSCGELLSDTDEPYICIVADGQPANVVALSSATDLSGSIYDGKLSVSDKEIVYTNSAAETGQEIIIRTGSLKTELTINAPKDVVRHYGDCGFVNIIAVAAESYHELGNVPFVEIAAGRIALEKGAKVKQLHFDATEEKKFNKIIVAADPAVTTLPAFSRDEAAIEETGTLVVELQYDTNNNDSTDSNYVWLYKQGVISQMVVVEKEIEGIIKNDAGGFVATNDSGTAIVLGVDNKADIAKKAAFEIANSYTGSNTSGAISVGEGKEIYLPKLDTNGDIEVVSGVLTADIAEKLGSDKTVEDVLSASVAEIASAVAIVDNSKKPAELQSKSAVELVSAVKEAVVEEGGLKEEAKESSKQTVVAVSVAEDSGKKITDGIGNYYGFHNSYLSDKGQAAEHWVHEITTAEEFRNIMDSTVHDGKNAQFDYPGAANKNTVYLIKNDIDFGGSIYSTAQIEEVKARPFTGILRGDGNVVLSNVHLTEIMGSSTTTNNSMWGLFDGILNASFESFTLANFTIKSSEGKVCGFLAAGQEGQNKPGASGFDPSAYLKVKDIVVASSCSINVNANAGSLFGNARNLDYIELDNCENNAEVIIAGGNVGGFIGSSSYDTLDIGEQNFNTHAIVVKDCINNGHIQCGSTGYASGLIGYNLHTGTISNFTNNGVIEIVGGGKSNVGVASGQTPNATLVTYDNVVQNSYIKYSGTTPLHAYENKSGNMQVYYTNGSGQLVSGFNGNNAPTEDYKNLAYSESSIVQLALSFNDAGMLVVADNTLNNVSKITVSLMIGCHTAQADGVVYNNKSTPNYQVYCETISSSGTTAELNEKGLKKVTQIGYFSPADITPTFPSDSWGRIAKYVEQYHLDTDLYGTEGYTDADMGYHINSKGGYVLVRNVISGVGFTVVTPLHEDPHFVVTAYDAEGNIVGTGMVYSGRITGEHIPEDIHVTAGIEKYVYSAEQ